jgi:DNA-binding response OmpR family regulator
MKKINKKILIVEDDADFLALLQERVALEGFSVFIARDGKEGLDVASKERPDLILLDILMPKMDGIEMAKRLKESGINISIIFLTNVGDVDYISKAIEASQSDYIVKSNISIDDIIARVKDKLGVK